MRCIFCSTEQPPTREHVFSLAIGGTITTNRVCAGCNSLLGSRVDSALNDFFPVRSRRAELGLAGNSGKPPSMFEIFLGEHNLISHQTTRIYTSLNRNGVKLDHRCLYRAADVVTQDGQRARKVTLDARDKDQIPKIIQRERKRHGIPPLSMEALTIEASKFTETTVEPLVVQINIDVNFAFLGHAMMKIAYELAFLWLGESYLDDPLAVELREAILENDIASTDDFAGYINWAETCTAFNLWTPHKAHHLAFASVAADSVVIAARVFDIYAIAIPVSRDASRYIKTGADATKLPFVAIDAVTGRTIQTTFGEEQRRLVREMQRHRKPPLPDPLSAEEMAVS